MSETADYGTAQSQLAWLGNLTDVVYAVALVLIIQWLPLPEESHKGWLVSHLHDNNRPVQPLGDRQIGLVES